MSLRVPERNRYGNDAKAPTPLRLLLGGDVMLGRGVARMLARHGAAYPFAALAQEFGHADLCFVNLECAQAHQSRVILLVHRQETMSLFGIPLMRYIDIQDAEEVIRAIQETDPQTPIDLILHTPGGLALPSLQIARALARHPAPVSAYVPHYAMSGGTLIALAADRIVMCEHAVLGPIDPQIEGYPAASILRAVARKDDKDIDDTTLILADQAEMAMTQLRRAVEALLQPQLQPQVAEYAAGALSERQWTHDYPITPGSACR